MNNNASVISRTDYQPFGEEISAGIGRRDTAQGYGVIDNNRQRYALTEKDDATGLDHTWWRKYDNKAGRWTSPDPYKGSMSIGSPQSFNRYSYVENDPINLIDPSGLYWALGNCRFVVVSRGGEIVWAGEVCNAVWVRDPTGGSGGVGDSSGHGGNDKAKEKEEDKKYEECRAKAERAKSVAESDAWRNAKDALWWAGLATLVSLLALPWGAIGKAVALVTGVKAVSDFARIKYDYDKAMGDAKRNYDIAMADCNRENPAAAARFNNKMRELSEKRIKETDPLLRPKPLPF
jgi:RHS repeat-associated protein